MKVRWQGQEHDAINAGSWLVPEALAVEKHFGTEINEFTNLEASLAIIYVTVKRSNPRFGWAALEALTVEEVDRSIAERLRDPERFLAPQMLSPLPVLGVPGWWPENEREDFYDNERYFRRGRRRKSGCDERDGA